MITLDGKIEKISFYNEENHYTIARFKTGQMKKVITVVGTLAGAGVGEKLKLKGNWEVHPKFGDQFKVDSFEVTLPASAGGIRKYLGSGIIKGIGPAMARKLVDHFKEETLDIIEKYPARLHEITGIGKAKAGRIADAWKEHHSIRVLMQFLQEHGVKTACGAALLREYGADAVSVIRSDPYVLAKEMPGSGFAVADALAMKLGISEDEPMRIRAALLFVMDLYANDGHVFCPGDRLTGRAGSMIRVPREKIESEVTKLHETGEVVVENGESGDSRVYLKDLYLAETGIAARLGAFLTVPVLPPELNPERITLEVLKKLAIQLSEEQLSALSEILAHRVVVITGGPGTGKTTLIRSVAAIFDVLGRRILLAAPTGRAARRLSEVTRKKAATIHRLLGYNLTTGEFDKNPDDPLDAEAVIIDEASMVDTFLMYHLLRAVPMNAVLILVGDIFQLPSVGPGNILSDIIRSGRVKTFELTTIFRQAQESPIVVNAHKIRQGMFPDFDRKDEETGLSEFYFIEQHNPDTVVNTIVELCSARIPKVFKHIDEIQVLTPMHKGEVGTINLNQVLQKVINKSPVTVETGLTTFRQGDKVMHLKNNYQKEVFNGDIGIITAIEKSRRTVTVDFEGREVEYDFIELDELTLAYTISVHKSQGSEYPAVVVPIMEQHYPLLQRNLLYTAMTRGKGLVIIVGTRKAVTIALNNDKPRQRLSTLDRRLMES